MSHPTKPWLTALLMVNSWPVNPLAAHSSEPESPQVFCIQRLRLPVYPPLAASARISGSVSAQFMIPAASTAQKENLKVHFTSTSPHTKSLEAAIQEALYQSGFSPACGGKTLNLTFHFELSGEAQPSVSFGYPLQFWISAKAPHWQP